MKTGLPKKIFHAFLLLVLHYGKPFEAKQKPKRDPKLLSIPLNVDVQIHKKKPVETIAKTEGQPIRRNAKNEALPSKANSTAGKGNRLPSPSLPAGSNQPSQSYSTLLPKPSEISTPTVATAPSSDGLSSRKHVWASSLGIDGKRKLIEKGGNLRAGIDVPLSARSVIELGKATARIARQSQANGFILVELVGQPLMRAVLFENLQTLSTKNALEEIFSTLGTQDFVFCLHLIAGNHISANDDSFLWRDNRLDVYLTKGRSGFSPRGLQWDGGLQISYTLPDEKADRAKEVDEDEYARLLKSPAYISQLSNRAL
ncbi:MAG: hypothetical protein EOP07_15650 [Proteobacteria bacterium]|nr:MAG: hypothetical protein EOP07_15650 [Pseudomonadota bacterium]